MFGRREFIQASTLALAASTFGVAVQRPQPKSEFDYVDWSWERWRAISRESRPKITGPQSGKAELIYPLGDASGLPITTHDWKLRRQSISSVISAFVGTGPKAKPALAPRLLEETKLATHTRRKISYQSEAGEHVPAYILIPNEAKTGLPAVLCPHQTTIPLTSGMREPAGLAGNPGLHTALHLVKRGFVTFTWDALCFGERHEPERGHYGDAIPFYRKHPHWSLLGKMVWDASRAIDYLETLEFVDPNRIASIGHSHGGITTLFSMAFDERIKVGVSNCGFDTFRIDGNVWRWSRATALLPRLGFFIGSPYLSHDFYRAVPDSEVVKTPFDLHQLLALVAPRPLLLSTSDEDFVFPNAGWSARQALNRVRPIYHLFGEEQRLGSLFFSAGHSFPEEIARQAYDWLERWLKA